MVLYWALAFFWPLHTAIFRALFTKVAKTNVFLAGWWWLKLFRYTFICVGFLRRNEPSGFLETRMSMKGKHPSSSTSIVNIFSCLLYYIILYYVIWQCCFPFSCPTAWMRPPNFLQGAEEGGEKREQLLVGWDAATELVSPPLKGKERKGEGLALLPSSCLHFLFFLQPQWGQIQSHQSLNFWVAFKTAPSCPLGSLFINGSG